MTISMTVCIILFIIAYISGLVFLSMSVNERRTKAQQKNCNRLANINLILSAVMMIGALIQWYS